MSLFCKSEVNELESIILRHHNILRFEISVTKEVMMEMMETSEHLSDVVTGTLFVKRSSIGNQIEQTSIWNKFQSKSHTLLWGIILVAQSSILVDLSNDLANVVMSELLLQVELFSDLVDVLGSALSELDSHLLVIIVLWGTKEDSSVTSFSKLLENVVA